jgi:hypothetical protein
LKIRGPSELNNFLSQSLAWRKQEIANLNLLIKSLDRPHEETLLRRCAVLFLYAHFEGFTKEAAEAYVDLVSRQGLEYNRLKSNFVAIGARSSIRDAANTNLMRLHIGVVEFLTHNQTNTAKFSSNNSIDTESNVNAKVFANILDTVGIQIDDYFSVRMLLLDGGLLAKRNAIAHGDRIEVNHDDYLQLHRLVIELLDHFRDCLENAAVLKEYER